MAEAAAYPRMQMERDTSEGSDLGACQLVRISKIREDDNEHMFLPSQSQVNHGSQLDPRKMVKVDFGEAKPYKMVVELLQHGFKCSSTIYKIKDIQLCENGEDTNCILLEFESTQDVTAFLESKDEKSNQVCATRCTEEEFSASQNPRTLLEEFTAKSRIPISQHKKKLFEFQKQYKSAVDEEIEAIASQVTTLEDQLKEFEAYLHLLETQLQGNEGLTQESTEILREGFAHELKKFGTAFSIYAHKSEILDLVKKNQVSIILGETGSGKSTQVVQYLLTAGYAEKGKIICTQPRKESAASLAERVSTELGSPVGELVGYHVGMQHRSREDTKIVYMTDSCLLNSCRNDPLFKQYSCIVIDEAHERSLQTDLLLGLIKRCLSQRPDLRVIITSTVIVPDVFVNFFDGAPVPTISGKMYPVRVIYGNDDVTNDQYKLDYVEKAVAKALEIHKDDCGNQGDILVFLTAGIETEKAKESLHSQLPNDSPGPQVHVLQLHGCSPPEEQRKAFQSSQPGWRKIIFATNIAETAITIPGIRYVVDTGMVKAPAFDHKRNMHILKVREISKSSAQKRKGRAGRASPGICYRLYSKDSFEMMDDMAKPEILSSHIGSAVLQLLSYGICDLHEFEFVESPPLEAISDALMMLEGLGACLNGELTGLGQQMAVLPLEPRLAKLLLRGIEMGFGTEAAIMTAVSSIGGSIFRAGTVQQRRDSNIRKLHFCEDAGDVITMLSVYKAWETIPEERRNEWCNESSINAKSMENARDNYNELVHTLRKELNISLTGSPSSDPSLNEKLTNLIMECFGAHLCIYSGHRNVGYYLFTQPSSVFHVHPTSPLMAVGQMPKWVVFETVLRTNKSYMMNATALKESDVLTYLESHGNQNMSLCEVEKLLLQKHTIKPIGLATREKFIGEYFKTVTDLKADLRKKCDGSVEIDVDHAKASFEIYARANDLKSVVGHVETKLNSILSEIADEMIEMPTKPGTNQRILVEAGLQAKTVMMETDYRTVTIKKVDTESLGYADVRKELELFGAVCDLLQSNHSTGAEQNPSWGKATFVNAADALQAVQRSDELPFEVHPHGQHKEAAECKITVEWCRRPLKGTAFIKFADGATLQDIENGVSFLNQHNFRAEISRNPNEIFVRGLPRTGENIRELQQLIEAGISGASVIIPRERVSPSSDSELSGLSCRISSILSQPGIPKELADVVMKPVEESSVNFKAIILVNDADISPNISRSLNECFRQPGLHITQRMFKQIIIPKQVVDVIKEDLEGLSNHLLEKFNVTMRTKDLHGSLSVEISGEDMNAIVCAKQEGNSLFNGELSHLLNDEFKALSSPRGKQEMDALQSSGEVLIRVDHRFHSVTIFGTSEKRGEALRGLRQCLKSLSSTSTKVIPLRGSDRPRGLMKRLVIIYGWDLQKLLAESGASWLDLNVCSHSLVFCGCDDSLEKLNSLVRKVQTDLEGEGESAAVASDKEECPICLCPVDDDCHVLELCQHVYCKECIVQQVCSACKEKVLPVKCAFKGCEKLFAIADARNILGKSLDSLQPLIVAALDQFIAKSQGKYKYCSTEDCSGVYKATKKPSTFKCPQCDKKICTTCGFDSHYGISCDVNKKLLANPDPIHDWIREDPLVRARCPSCGIGIEKNEGCAHVVCLACCSHICWHCMQCFETSQSCYSHLDSVHGSYN